MEVLLRLDERLLWDGVADAWSMLSLSEWVCLLRGIVLLIKLHISLSVLLVLVVYRTLSRLILHWKSVDRILIVLTLVDSISILD